MLADEKLIEKLFQRRNRGELGADMSAETGLPKPITIAETRKVEAVEPTCQS